jgi:hypothetical protein
VNGGRSGVSSLVAAIASAAASLTSGIAAFSLSADKVLGGVAALMAGGFLFFVRKWMSEREDNDRRVMDTLRAQNEKAEKQSDKQAEIERVLYHFIGQVQGRLGLHSIDSDPAIEIRTAHKPPAPHEPRPTNGPTE